MLTTLRIKNMVCGRCRRVVDEDLTSLGLHVVDVRLGGATVEHETPLPLDLIRETLVKGGFDLVEDRTSALIEHVKSMSPKATTAAPAAPPAPTTPAPAGEKK